MMIIDDLPFRHLFGGYGLRVTVTMLPPLGEERAMESPSFHPFPASSGEPKCRKTCKCRESGHSSTITPWCEWWLVMTGGGFFQNFPTWYPTLSNLVSNLVRFLRCCLDSCGFLDFLILFNHVKSRLFGSEDDGTSLFWLLECNGAVLVLAIGGQNAIVGKCGTTASTLLDCCLPFHFTLW